MGTDEWISLKLFCKIAYVQKSVEIINIWLDDFLQNEHAHVTSPLGEDVLIGQGEKNLATVHQKKLVLLGYSME